MAGALERVEALREAELARQKGVRAGVCAARAGTGGTSSFEAVHPFADGNGRIGREILNLMLKRSKYPRLLFLGSDRDHYIEALLAGNSDEYTEMVSVFARIMVKQRRAILLEKLKEMVVSVKRTG